jgi:hypothetical protein
VAFAVDSIIAPERTRSPCVGVGIKTSDTDFSVGTAKQNPLSRFLYGRTCRRGLDRRPDSKFRFLHFDSIAIRRSVMHWFSAISRAFQRAAEASQRSSRCTSESSRASFARCPHNVYKASALAESGNSVCIGFRGFRHRHPSVHPGYKVMPLISQSVVGSKISSRGPPAGAWVVPQLRDNGRTRIIPRRQVVPVIRRLSSAPRTVRFTVRFTPISPRRVSVRFALRFEHLGSSFCGHSELGEQLRHGHEIMCTHAVPLRLTPVP